MEPEAVLSFDTDYKAKLLTQFYTDLFTATEVQRTLPKWVRLEDYFNERDLEGMPRIDGLLLRKAINLFANNKSCAEDGVVAEMLSVLSEDVLETLAEAFINRILNREGKAPEDLVKKTTRARDSSSTLRRTPRIDLMVINTSIVRRRT